MGNISTEPTVKILEQIGRSPLNGKLWRNFPLIIEGAAVDVLGSIQVVGDLKISTRKGCKIMGHTVVKWHNTS